MLYCLCQFNDGPGNLSDLRVCRTRGGVFNESAKTELGVRDRRYVLAFLEVVGRIEYYVAESLKYCDAVVTHVPVVLLAAGPRKVASKLVDLGIHTGPARTRMTGDRELPSKGVEKEKRRP